MYAKRFRVAAGAAAVMLLAASLPALAAAGALADPTPGNLLTNGSWEDGFHRQDGVPELTVPDGWRLWYLDRESFEGVPEGWLAYRPETVVWPKYQAPGEERSLFWLDGEYTFKVFKGFALVYAAISQDVSGLQVGRQYLFTAPIFVDIYTGVVNGQKQAPGDGGMVRLGVSPVGAAWRDASQIAYTQWFGPGNWPNFYLNMNHFTYNFTATAPRMTVWVEMASKYGFGNNGFFLDNLSLVPVGGVTAAATAQASAPAATPTPSPTPADVLYTVQPGDTLSVIARRFGVSMTTIIEANKLRDANVVRLGKVLRIPGVAAAASTVGASATATPAVASTSAASSPAAQDTLYTVQIGDTLTSIARKFGLTTSVILQANNLADPNIVRVGKVLRIPGVPSETAGFYTVQRGDSLGSIANQFEVTVQALLAVNPGLVGSLIIFPGQVLNIP